MSLPNKAAPKPNQKMFKQNASYTACFDVSKCYAMYGANKLNAYVKPIDNVINKHGNNDLENL